MINVFIFQQQYLIFITSSRVVITPPLLYPAPLPVAAAAAAAAAAAPALLLSLCEKPPTCK